MSRRSQHDLVRWVEDLLGLDELDAYQLVSQVAGAPAGNVVDTNYTMVATFPKAVLGAAQPYQGVHARLTAAARALHGD